MLLVACSYPARGFSGPIYINYNPSNYINPNYNIIDGSIVTTNIDPNITLNNSDPISTTINFVNNNNPTIVTIYNGSIIVIANINSNVNDPTNINITMNNSGSTNATTKSRWGPTLAHISPLAAR